jgi:hypothetical protein
MYRGAPVVSLHQKSRKNYTGLVQRLKPNQEKQQQKIYDWLEQNETLNNQFQKSVK